MTAASTADLASVVGGRVAVEVAGELGGTGALVAGLLAVLAPDEQPARTAAASRNAGPIIRHEGLQRGTVMITTSPIALRQIFQRDEPEDYSRSSCMHQLFSVNT